MLTTLMRRLAAAALVAAGTAAWAADGPCRDDARRLCGGVQPGGGRGVACLRQHGAELTPACRAALPTLEQCAAELRRVCDGAGRRDLRKCMRDHADTLSPSCRAMAPQR